MHQTKLITLLPFFLSIFNLNIFKVIFVSVLVDLRFFVFIKSSVQVNSSALNDFFIFVVFGFCLIDEFKFWVVIVGILSQDWVVKSFFLYM